MSEDWPVCPGCSATVDMSDSDVYCAHTSYWADGETVRPHTCRACGLEFRIQEHVSRWWTARPTPAPAQGEG